MRNDRLFAVLVGALTLAGCRSVPDQERPARSARAAGPALRFAYGTTDGSVLDNTQTYGRVTLLLFVTTFDLASQVEATRLNDVLHGHRPRVNVAAVVLEAPKYAALADAFQSSLKLDYAVGIADEETRRGSGPFGRVDRVPTLVVLDAEGREVWRKAGLIPARELEDVLRNAQRAF